VFLTPASLICIATWPTTAVDAFKCDALNNARVKTDFVQSLRLDVLESLVAIKKQYTAANATWLAKGRDVVKGYKTMQATVAKALAKQKRCNAEAVEAREKLVEAKLNTAAPVTASTMLKLSKAVVTTMEEAATANSTSQNLRSKFQVVHSTFDAIMTEILNNLQKNEESRVDVVKAALRRHLVIETSFLANRQYDVQNLVSVMEDVNPVRLHSICLVTTNQRTSRLFVFCEYVSMYPCMYDGNRVCGSWFVRDRRRLVYFVCVPEQLCNCANVYD
jgi:hypothetical protein